MCAFKKGFLIYQVDVKNVSAKMTSSFLPESSRRSGEYLNPVSVVESPTNEYYSPDDEQEIVDDVF